MPGKIFFLLSLQCPLIPRAASPSSTATCLKPAGPPQLHATCAILLCVRAAPRLRDAASIPIARFGPGRSTAGPQGRTQGRTVAQTHLCMYLCMSHTSFGTCAAQRCSCALDRFGPGGQRGASWQHVHFRDGAAGRSISSDRWIFPPKARSLALICWLLVSAERVRRLSHC